jgi:hypothetical protein
MQWAMASCVLALAGCAFDAADHRAPSVLEDEAEPATIASSRESVDPAADPNVLRDMYESWKLAHEARGGDRHLTLQLNELRHVSVIPTSTQGTVHLDLLGGSIALEIPALPSDEATDVWLVDNAANSSVLPDANDTMVRIGRIELGERGSDFVFETKLDPTLLRDFDIDVVAISLAGQTPVEAGVLFGRVPLFNRMYTAERAQSELGLVTKSKGIVTNDYVPTTTDLSDLVQLGLQVFTQETFGGNGRTCATCHRVENNFTIDPAFIAKLPASDPLFVHEQKPELAELESPRMLRELGLIRANVDGLDKLARLRSVSHIKSIATGLNFSHGRCAPGPTFDPSCGFPPNIGPFDLRNKPTFNGPLARAAVREGLVLTESTGWSGDGAPHDGSLLSFAVGAIAQHFPKTLNRVEGVDFRAPTEEEADAMLAFQLAVGRKEEVNTRAITFASASAARGFGLFNNNPGGCKDQNGVSHCACTFDVLGESCGLDVPSVPDGAGCAGCHTNTGSNIDLSQVPVVAAHLNLNADIGTAGRPHPIAEAIQAESGEPFPLDCGLGRLSAAEHVSVCRKRASWPPQVIDAYCDGSVDAPKRTAYCPDPQGNPTACTGACGFPGAPACNGWFGDVDPGAMREPTPGKNPFALAGVEQQFPKLSWYFVQASACDFDPIQFPLPIVTAGAAAQSVCDSAFGDDLEWSANGGQAFCASNNDCARFGGASSCVSGMCTNVPACKCTTNASCAAGQICFRQPGVFIDGYCLDTHAFKTPFDKNNPEHVQRAGNRVMVEPTPDWNAFKRVSQGGSLPPGIPGAAGDACNPFLNGTPAGDAQCFGPQTCVRNHPFNPASGVCGADQDWTPEVLSLCEHGTQNPALLATGGYGCYEGNPNPRCQNCKADCTGKGPGCVPCNVDVMVGPVENHCAADNNPADPALHGYGDGTFSVPPALESPDTAPYFHDHSAERLEDVIRHYTTELFAASPGAREPVFVPALEPLNIDEQEIADIAAYLRVLNAAQNVSEAQRAIELAFATPKLKDGRTAFADTEIEDAIGVLADSYIHEDARARFAFARNRLIKAWKEKKVNKVGRWLARAAYHLDRGRADLLTVTSSPAIPRSAYTKQHLDPDVPANVLSAAGNLADEEKAFAEFLAEQD